MKRIFTILTAVLLTASVFAQTPEKMSYQAVVRDADNNLVTSQNVYMRISIYQSSVNNIPIYVETQIPTTNDNGLVTIQIGDGITIDDFSAIDWTNGDYFMKTEIDPTGGTNYTIIGISQLLSVPYALYAKTAENVFSGDYQDLTNKPDISNAGTIVQSDWNAEAGADAEILNKPTLATVSTSGDYNDLTNIPNLSLKANAEDVYTKTNLQTAGQASINYANITDKPDLTGYLTEETDGDITNEIQTLNINENVITLTNGGSITLPAAVVGFDGNFTNLTNVPTGLSDGDDDTQLSETQVDDFVADNGYITEETDPAVLDNFDFTGVVTGDLLQFNGTKWIKITPDYLTSSSDAASVTSADITNLGNLSGTNTGDQNLTALSLKSNVLELDNITTFTPDADYEPATKKYVDDISITESQISDLQSYLTSYTETDPSYTSSEAANVTASDITNLGNLSGTNTGDQNLTALALKSNVLELDNTTTFTPDADYEPATKKYVDDISITESQISDLQSYLTSYTETDPSYTILLACLPNNLYLAAWQKQYTYR